MDYGEPAAQFHSADLVAKGTGFIGKKITVKGTVDRIDTSTPESSWVYLEGGIRCHFREFSAMAQSYGEGQTIYVDGFLRNCETGDVLLDPAMGRDPTASFEPIE